MYMYCLLHTGPSTLWYSGGSAQATKHFRSFLEWEDFQKIINYFDLYNTKSIHYNRSSENVQDGEYN